MAKNRIKPSEITPEDVFMNRRQIIAGAVAAGLVPGLALESKAATIPAEGDEFEGVTKWPKSLGGETTPWEDVTTYNNYYEFGTGKGDPARNAHSLKTDPWTVEVTGEANKRGKFALEDILKPHALEERIY